MIVQRRVLVLLAITAVLASAASSVLAGQVQAMPPQMVGLPSLTVSQHYTPPYVLAKPCAWGEAAITFRLIVRNYGNGASPAINDIHAIWVQDSANPAWANGVTLPAIPVNNGIPVDVTLVGLKNPNDMAGHHVFNVTFKTYGANSIAIPVDFPPAFCAPPVSVAPLGAAAPPQHTPSPYAVLHQVMGGLPAPTNLTNTITQGVCAAHGGSAGSLACYIGLPAGKLVLVWDYPFSNQIDGYRIYGTTPILPGHVIQMVGGNKPSATQSDPSVKLIVLDPPAPGTCFAVTAFHGSDESARSATSYCVGQGGVSKTASFTPVKIGAMTTTVGVWVYKSVEDNMYDNKTGSVGGIPKFQVGYGHYVDLWRDTAHTQPSHYTNIFYRGYLYFSVYALAGRHVASARLNLTGAQSDASGGETCVAQYAAAAHLWNPGDQLNFGGQVFGGSRYQGPDLHLDVTSIVQAWADAPSSNYGFVVDGDQSLDSYHMVIIPAGCLTWSFSSMSLDVTYY